MSSSAASPSTSKRPNSKPSTPPTRPRGNDIDDVQYLLYLEAVRRFREQQTNIRRQVVEKIRLYNEVNAEYLELYGQYAELLEQTALRHTLESNEFLDDTLTESTKGIVAQLNETLSSQKLSDYLDSEQLAACREKLNEFEPHDDLSKMKDELVEVRATLKRIASAVECTETTLETAIVQCVDNAVEDIKMENFELSTT